MKSYLTVFIVDVQNNRVGSVYTSTYQNLPHNAAVFHVVSKTHSSFVIL